MKTNTKRRQTVACLKEDSHKILEDLKKSKKIKSNSEIFSLLIRTILGCSEETRSAMLMHIREKKSLAEKFQRDSFANDGNEFWLDHDTKIVEDYENLEKLFSLPD